MNKKIVITAFLSVLIPLLWGEDSARAIGDRKTKDAEADLNKVYQELRRVLREPNLTALKEAQLAWLKFRDHEASLRAGISSQGGSSYTTDYLDVRIDLTIDRTKQLLRVLKLAQDLE